MIKWIISFASLLISATGLTCLSDTGSPTDTWLIMKEPHSTSYLYADPSQQLQPSQHSSLNSSSFGALTLTTEQMWKADTYVIYNDENPMNTTYSYSFGHTKGYLFFNDDATGVWIQHSIPQFPVGPKFAAAYEGLTHNAWTNAQHIFCMSLTATTINKIADGMLLNRPRVNDWKLSLVGSQFGSVAALATEIYSVQPNCKTVPIQTRGGAALTVFAKSAEWGHDIWDDCITATIDDSIYVQSWLQGQQLGPYCPTTGETVEDIQSVDFGDGFTWDNSVDHSKWGVSNSGTTVCFGDINRVVTQATRGGGAVCTSQPNYSTGFASAVSATDSC